ncbi:MAG: T9SS type A sorting domain-containing protein, partial [Bacteroidales bacterium]|nr:T9SS type A sorting domain-containing protein [Bacteroidales bacterium]
TEATNIIFKLDLDNQMLVDSITTDISNIRHCSFNRQDGSLLAGDWNSLYSIDTATGVSTQIRNDLMNVYSSAYDNLSPGGPYLWLFSQTSQNNGPSAYIRQFSISNGDYTDKTHYLDDIGLGNASLAGGICASEQIMDGKFVLLADVQNPSGNNIIATYEIGRTNNVVRTGKKSGSIEPNSSESISVCAFATATGEHTAKIKYRAAVMGRQSNDINVGVSTITPECAAIQQISIATDTFHTVTLDWQPIDVDENESVSYLVYTTGSQYPIDTLDGTSVTYSPSVGDNCFYVRALSTADYTCLSEASDTVCATIKEIPCDISLVVNARSNGEFVTLSWNTSVGIDHFSLYRNSEPIDENITATTFVDTDVVAEIDYCYTVIAHFENSVCSEITGIACIRIATDVCAEAPALTAEVFGNSVHLNWTVTSDSYTYRIFRDDVAIGLTTDTTYFDNVTYGYNYCYKVESLCDYGMFIYSNEECVFVNEEDDNAIDEWTADNLTLYPNPTYGQFFIEGQRIAVVQIFNASGMLVAEIENTESGRVTINCDGWNPGLYNVRIISAEGETATRKVTIFR